MPSSLATALAASKSVQPGHTASEKARGDPPRPSSLAKYNQKQRDPVRKGAELTRNKPDKIESNTASEKAHGDPPRPSSLAKYNQEQRDPARKGAELTRNRTDKKESINSGKPHTHTHTLKKSNKASKKNNSHTPITQRGRDEPGNEIVFVCDIPSDCDDSGCTDEKNHLDPPHPSSLMQCNQNKREFVREDKERTRQRNDKKVSINNGNPHKHKGSPKKNHAASIGNVSHGSNTQKGRDKADNNIVFICDIPSDSDDSGCIDECNARGKVKGNPKERYAGRGSKEQNRGKNGDCHIAKTVGAETRISVNNPTTPTKKTDSLPTPWSARVQITKKHQSNRRSQQRKEKACAHDRRRPKDSTSQNIQRNFSSNNTPASTLINSKDGKEATESLFNVESAALKGRWADETSSDDE